MFLYDFATKTAQKPDTVATYIRRNEKIFKNHVERREKMYSLSIWVIFFSFLALFSTILEFLFDDKFDTGYFSSRLNWLKFNIYIGQFIDFCLCFF